MMRLYNGILPAVSLLDPVAVVLLPAPADDPAARGGLDEAATAAALVAVLGEMALEKVSAVEPKDAGKEEASTAAAVAPSLMLLGTLAVSLAAPSEDAVDMAARTPAMPAGGGANGAIAAAEAPIRSAAGAPGTRPRSAEVDLTSAGFRSRIRSTQQKHTRAHVALGTAEDLGLAGGCAPSTRFPPEG